MEGESDIVDGCSFLWEVGMKVIKGCERASLELRDQFAVTKPQISGGELGPVSRRRFQGGYRGNLVLIT